MNKILKLFLLNVWFCTSSACAQTKPISAFNKNELAAFFDSVFISQMGKEHIAGAVIILVKDGEVLFKKGYGYANVEKKTPVDPDETIFRIGSVTKVFTATTVLQLADKGLIQMEDDVNSYLKDWKVPVKYGRPITFANLLTHSAAFDEISPGRKTTNAHHVIPLGKFIKDRLVPLHPPGQFSSYSTYGISLAAYLVETITGTPFKKFITENIFNRLAMNHTSIADVPEKLKSKLATGYVYSQTNGYQPLAFVWFNTYPASDINSTASDMGRFMLAHLQGSKYGNNRILSDNVQKEMLRRQHSNHPDIVGWSYGFQESRVLNNQKGVEHGGSMDDGYSSLMYMIPDQGLGLFTACNTENTRLHDFVKESVVDRFYPLTEIPKLIQPADSLQQRLDRFAGEYRWNVYCHTCDSTVFKPASFKVVSNNDGTISFFAGKWVQIKPLVFQLADGKLAGQVIVAFRENDEGAISHFFLGGPFTYEKIK